MWDYFENKNVIKIELDLEYNDKDENDGIIVCSYDDFLNSTDLDIPFFKSFCDIFIYIHYKIENDEYINVYQKDNSICSTDFLINETELSKKYRDVICASFDVHGKQVYITKYFKMFLNNNSITPELLLLHNDQIKSLDASLNIINGKNIVIHQLNEKM